MVRQQLNMPQSSFITSSSLIDEVIPERPTSPTGFEESLVARTPNMKGTYSF
jgi:hypothetical protein